MAGVETSVFLFLICILPVINSARILAYYPTPSISHQVVFRPLTNELVKRGHQVTVVTTDPQYPKGNSPANLTEVDVHDFSYQTWRDQFLTRPPGRKDDLTAQMSVIFILMLKILEKQFQHEEVKKVLDKNNNYDLLIVEGYSRPLLALSHIFNVPMIQFSSLGLVLDNYQHLGIPQHELLYPTIMRNKLYDLTVWEKIKELYEWFSLVWFYQSFEHEESAMVKRALGDNVPSFSELANNIDLMLINIHPIFEGIRPLPPNVIHVYGIHKIPKNALPADLKSYLDSSKNGVIYVSFGTNVKPSLLPPETIQVLVKALSALPYDVLWKWDADEMVDKSKNIKIAKWLPQSDLLRHPNIKLFITQGGLQSTDESIEAGVPLLGIPMLGDQWFNVERYVKLKIGLRLDMEYLTDESVSKTINKLIKDGSYRQNVVKLRSLMHDEPQKPLDRAIWWTEYVLRNGGAKHLRSPGANLAWMEYFEINLVLILLTGLFVSSSVVLTIFYYLCIKDNNSKHKVKRN